MDNLGLEKPKQNPGGILMAKVVKAFSIEPKVAKIIDSYTSGNRSKLVNLALEWYFLSDIHEIIEMKDSEAAYWKAKCISKQGVKHHLEGLLRCLNPFPRQKQV